MEAPDKIYVPQHNIEAGNIQELDELVVAGSTEYIRKDALLEWAKEKLAKYVKLQNEKHQDPTHWGQRNAFQQIIDKLNSI